MATHFDITDFRLFINIAETSSLTFLEVADATTRIDLPDCFSAFED